MKQNEVGKKLFELKIKEIDNCIKNVKKNKRNKKVLYSENQFYMEKRTNNE